MATVLKGATLVEFEPAAVEVAELRIDGGRIVARGSALAPQPNDEVIDVTGRLVLPGLVSAHHHLHAVLLRGARRVGGGFSAEQAALRALEAALDGDGAQAAAAASGLEGLLSGTTTVFGVHAAPGAGASLRRVAAGLRGVGLRSVLASRVSDAAGAVAREVALEENADFLGVAQGRVRGALALADLDTLSEDAVLGLQALRAGAPPLTLVALGEDPAEEARCRERFGVAPVERLLAAGLLGPRTVAAHLVHLSWPELSQLIGCGTWMAHSSRSDMATQAGLATAGKFGARACLATHRQPLDVLAEAQAAALRATDSGLPIDLLRFLANGHRLASEAFGAPIGPLREGAVADLVVSDYAPPTPLTPLTLAGHVLEGLSARHVESVMVDGAWWLWKRQPLGVEGAEVARAAREAAEACWARASERGAPPRP